MKITINDVFEYEEKIIVSFYSTVGAGFAKWASSEKPSKNNSYDVELDIEKTVSEAWDKKNSYKPKSALMVDGTKVIVQGILESIDEDGMAYLRISPDGLIMIEAGEGTFSEDENVILLLEYTDLKVTALGV